MSSTRSKTKHFDTPQRGGPSRNDMPPPKEVTPFDPSPTSSTSSSASNKSVRFQGKAVSRRGGRFGSPSRISYKSPQRSNSQEVPSLCSSKDSPPSEEEGETPSQISFAKSSAAAASPLASPNKKKDQRRNVTFSPPRPQPADGEKQSYKKTPTRSPNFHNLPSLQDAKLSSPCGIFLSPCPPSPSIPQIKKQFEKEGNSRRASTPTDFSVDFAKSHKLSASFDASNVLAWLQSPTANGLFSPGAFSSAVTTPRGAPRTPTVSTSFFFSDVAGLPRGEPKRMSSMISISPLASRKGKVESPKPRNMPSLGDSPAVKDAVERELMEDEDLTVLLQLASHNTPRTKEGSDVFRSTRGRKSTEYRDNDNPALQLPIIGGKEGESGPPRKLSRKNRNGSNKEDFTPPALGIRSSSSGASREMFSRSEEEGATGKPKEGTTENDESLKKKDSTKKSAKKNGYPYPPYPPHPDAPPPYYAPIPGSVPSMPPGGSMRVVVGGPPPMNSRPSGKKNSSTSPNRSTPPRHPGAYPMPPEGYGPPPPGSMYPPMSHHYPPPHMTMAPYGHYAPPPRHMPMYAHPPPKGKGKGKGKPGKTPKRALPSSESNSPNSTKRLKSKSDKHDDRGPAAVPSSTSVSSNADRSALNAALLRGVTMRPSGKWQAQLYYAGKSRYIGVFDTREKAALAYEIAREKLKSDGKSAENSQSTKATENAVNAARKAAFEGVNGKDSRISSSKGS